MNVPSEDWQGERSAALLRQNLSALCDDLAKLVGTWSIFTTRREIVLAALVHNLLHQKASSAIELVLGRGGGGGMNRGGPRRVTFWGGDNDEAAGYSIQLVVPQLSVSAKARCTSVVCVGHCSCPFA